MFKTKNPKMIRGKIVIEFRDVSKVYDSNGTKALNNVNIKIEDGEFVFIVGFFRCR